MASIQIKRGTRAQLDAAASASGLKVGELYLVTDESKLAVGLSVSTYQDCGLSNPVDNGVVINGVANFWQPTAPTLRVDGSALVDGDIWYDVTDSVTWYRKGIYWVSAPLRYSDRVFANGVDSIGFQTKIPAPNSLLTFSSNPKNGLLYIESIYIHNILSQSDIDAWTLDASNYFIYVARIASVNFTLGTITSPEQMAMNVGITYPIDQVIASRQFSSDNYICGLSPVGNPSLQGTSWVLQYEYIMRHIKG